MLNIKYITKKKVGSVDTKIIRFKKFIYLKILINVKFFCPQL